MPTTSPVTISNRALFKIGEARITSLTDGSKAAKILNEIYAEIRDEVLEAHPWNFALKRLNLSEISTEPVWKFTHAFEIPQEVLRVVETDIPHPCPWKVETNEAGSDILVCNESSVKVLAICRVEDESRFSKAFCEAFACRLAEELAFSMTGTAATAEKMNQLYKSRLDSARSSDAQEGRPDRISASSWKTSRLR